MLGGNAQLRRATLFLLVFDSVRLALQFYWAGTRDSILRRSMIV